MTGPLEFSAAELPALAVPPVDARLIDTADRAELEARYPELATPVVPAYLRPGSAPAVLAALDHADAVDQSGARVLAAALSEARALVDALYDALTAGAEGTSGGERR